MGKKQDLFDAAVTLRTEGKTLQEIQDTIGVSKNTLTKWFREEGVDELKKMIDSHPLRQIEIIDRTMTKIFQDIEEADGVMTPTQTDTLAKLTKVRERLAKPGSEDLLRNVILVCSKLAHFAAKYFELESERKLLAGLLKAFFAQVKSDMER